jgi:hypothetical protein
MRDEAPIRSAVRAEPHAPTAKGVTGMCSSTSHHPARLDRSSARTGPARRSWSRCRREMPTAPTGGSCCAPAAGQPRRDGVAWRPDEGSRQRRHPAGRRRRPVDNPPTSVSERDPWVTVHTPMSGGCAQEDGDEGRLDARRWLHEMRCRGAPVGYVMPGADRAGVTRLQAWALRVASRLDGSRASSRRHSWLVSAVRVGLPPAPVDMAARR